MDARIQAEFDKLREDLTAQTTVIGGAKTAFDALTAQLKAAETQAADAGANDDQLAAFVAVRQGLEANTAALAAAVPANTTAASEPPAAEPASSDQIPDATVTPA